MNNYKQIEEKVLHAVKEYIQDMGHYHIQGIADLSQDEIEHILRIGTEIMINYWGHGKYQPGSFVQSILDNDLKGSFSKADATNQRAVKLYVMMMVNLKSPFKNSFYM